MKPKHLLLTTIAAVLVVGCGESQQPAPAPEAKPAEPVVEAAKPETPTAKAPNIAIHFAAFRGNLEAVKQHLAAGTDVNAKDDIGKTPLHRAADAGHKEIVELLIAKGADVNASISMGTPLHYAARSGHKEIVELLIAEGADVNAGTRGGLTPLSWTSNTEIEDLLRKHGGKTKKELEAATK